MRCWPGLLAGLVVGAALLAMATMAGPVFIASASNVTLEEKIADSTTWGAGLTVYHYQPLFGRARTPQGARDGSRRELIDEVTGMLDEKMKTLPRVGSLTLSVLASQMQVAGAGGDEVGDVHYVYRQGFRDNIDVVEGSRSAQGVWVPESVAQKIGVHPGDTVEMILRSRTTPAPVAGVYRDLYNYDIPFDPFWSPMARYITPTPDSTPPSFLLADRHTFFATEKALKDSGQVWWQYPIEPRGITLDDGRRDAAVFQRVGASTFDPSSAIGSALLLSGAFASNTTFTTDLKGIVSSTERAVAGLSASIDAVSLAGRILGLLIIGTVGVTGVRRRSTEITLLLARGAGPPTLAARLGLEAVIPIVLGAAAGAAAGYRLVDVAGPGGVIPRAAADAALVQCGVAAAAAVVVVGVVSAVTALGEPALRRAGAAAQRIPWEIPALLLAAASLYEVLTRGAGVVTSGDAPPKVDVLLVLFPILLVAGVAGVVARLLRRVLPAVRNIGRDAAPSAYLAASRIAASSRAALGLVSAAAIALGVLAYSSILISSVRATMGIKAYVATGSDVAIPVDPSFEMPAGLHFPHSVVVRMVDFVTAEPGATPVTVLAVDPQTFERAAFWSASFGSPSPGDALRGLDHRADGSDGVPALVVGGDAVPSTISIGSLRIALDPLRHLKGFPGMTGNTPMIVADKHLLRTMLERQGGGFGTAQRDDELWVKGDPPAILAAAERIGIPVQGATTEPRVADSPEFRSVAWTFGLLEALGVAAGAAALIGMLLYLGARQRQRMVSYALARRMGLQPASHRRAVAIELFGMMLAAFCIGVASAGLASWLVYRKLDPIPGLPPAPVLDLPWFIIGAIALTLAAAATIGSVFVQRAADRAHVAEVMRVAG
jgi:putative ABC transport system permease protein